MSAFLLPRKECDRMPKKPDERIDQAKQMYLDGMKLIDISRQLDLPEGTVRRWKSTHKWDSDRSDKINANVRIKRKRGGQPGNHNATGPPGNRHAEKHGFFTKWLPEETRAILDEIHEDDPLDLLWDNIQLQYAAIIRGQKLMYVKDQKDKTIEKIEEKDGNVCGEKWEVQQAWDKHATFMSAQSRAIGTLLRLVKEYDELLHKNWDTATEIQKAQLEQIQAQTKKLQTDVQSDGTEVKDWKMAIIDAANKRKTNE